MKTQPNQRVAEESMDEYCRRIDKELSDFLNAPSRQSMQLDEYVDPPDPAGLPVQSSAVVGDVTDGELYSEVLLPRFLEFTEASAHPILGYDKTKELERFETILDTAVIEFSEQISPVVYGGHIYYLRLTPKAGYSLPSDVRARRDYLETHAPFDAKYYRHTEGAFFRLCNYYVNLYAQNHRMQRQNRRLLAVVLVGVLLLIGILAAWFDLGE